MANYAIDSARLIIGLLAGFVVGGGAGEKPISGVARKRNGPANAGPVYYMPAKCESIGRYGDHR